MKTRGGFLLLILSLVLSGFSVAQHPPAAEHQQAPPQHAQPAGHGAQQPADGGTEGALSQASHEAAGEGEGHNEFKQSPTVKWLAGLLGLAPSAAYWVLITINFLIIAAAIFYFSKSSVPAMFRARTESIQKSMEEARKASEEANRRLGGIEERLSRLDTEIAKMRAAAEAEAAQEEQRIMATVEEEKRKVVQSAESEIAAAVKLARRDLKAYAAELAVSLAEKRIHIDPGTDHALVSSFVDQLGKVGR
jgi:F-type H+-transporting ATPase subunit b